VPQYEALRNAAFGQALPPEARSGLLLFLRRGMLGWARVMATAGPSPPPQPRRETSLSFPTPQHTMPCNKASPSRATPRVSSPSCQF